MLFQPEAQMAVDGASNERFWLDFGPIFRIGSDFHPERLKSGGGRKRGEKPAIVRYCSHFRQNDTEIPLEPTSKRFR